VDADGHRYDDTAQPLVCEHCRAPIGVYEPLVYLDQLGEAVRCSLLRLPGSVRRAADAVAIFHAGCHDPARAPPREGSR
jgi:hypothetical protein